MKGYFGIALVLCVVAVAQAAITKKEAEAAFRVLAAGCVEKTGADPSEVEAILQRQPFKSRNGKCLAECVMKKTEALTADGKIDKDRVLQIAAVFTSNDQAKLKIVADVTDTCSSITDSDHCELASKIRDCVHQAIKDKNIELTW